MNAKDVIRDSIQTADFVLRAYVGDLTDAELLIRPVPGMNHSAWQLGHIVAGERFMLEKIAPGASPELPEGFEAAHGPETKDVDDPARFHPKATYLELWDAQRKATLAALDAFDEARFDDPSGVEYAPTLGSLFNMIGHHAMMHAGQFVALRRQLGKPVTI